MTTASPESSFVISKNLALKKIQWTEVHQLLAHWTGDPWSAKEHVEAFTSNELASPLFWEITPRLSAAENQVVSAICALEQTEAIRLDQNATISLGLFSCTWHRCTHYTPDRTALQRGLAGGTRRMHIILSFGKRRIPLLPQAVQRFFRVQAFLLLCLALLAAAFGGILLRNYLLDLAA